jgi:hypothetical protein
VKPNVCSSAWQNKTKILTAVRITEVITGTFEVYLERNAYPLGFDGFHVEERKERTNN